MRGNRPLDLVHDVYRSYGRLLLPLGRGSWLMWTKYSWDLCVVNVKHFHNCTSTGVR